MNSEIQNELHFTGQIVEISNVESRINDFRQQNPHVRVVFTNGCFDVLHVGHIRYLREARQLGDFLVVGLNSDQSVKRLKGEKRPLQCQEDRAEILSSLRFVDWVCIFDEDTPEKLIQRVRPQILVKGGDWNLEKIVGAEFVKSYGGEVRSLTFVPGKSSTNLMEQMKS